MIERARVCRCCTLFCRPFREMRFGRDAVDESYVDCAEGSNIARPQAAGTGTNHLPSAGDSTMRRCKVTQRSRYQAVVDSTQRSGDRQIEVDVVFASCTWIQRSLSVSDVCRGGFGPLQAQVACGSGRSSISGVVCRKSCDIVATFLTSTRSFEVWDCRRQCIQAVEGDWTTVGSDLRLAHHARTKDDRQGIVVENAGGMTRVGTG